MVSVLLLRICASANDSAENWDNKGKFPPGIKPLLAQVALKAVALDEYDEDFFNLMPTLFPYNKFTMTVSLRLLFALGIAEADYDALLETYQANNILRSCRVAE